MLYSLSFLLALAATTTRAAFFGGACASEALTKTRQPLVVNPLPGAVNICFGFDLSRDDASALLKQVGIDEAAPHTASATQCEALLNAAVDAAVACVKTALNGSAATLSSSAQSAAVDVATALGCAGFNAIDGFAAALIAGNTKTAVAKLAANAFCTADSCRCQQNSYCLDPCVATTFGAGCAIAPASEQCAVAAAPFQCSYSGWTKTTNCNAACRSSSASSASGVELYTRTVNDARQCSGSLSENRACSIACAKAASPNGGGYTGAPVNAPNVNANADVAAGNNAQTLDNNTIGAIVGGTLGALLLVGLLVFLVRRRGNGNSKDRGDVYNPSHNVPAVANPLFSDANQARENPLFSEDSLQKINAAPVPAPIVVAAAAAPVSLSSHADDNDDDKPRKARKAGSKKKLRATESAAELAVCLTCGKEFKDAGLLRLHATSHESGNDDDNNGGAGNDTFASDNDTFATRAVKRVDSLIDDKPALAISSQGSVANLMDNSDL